MNTDKIILKKDCDLIAAALSVVPGLGHIYKGHSAAGFLIVLLGIPVGLWVGILLSLATAGIGLLVPVTLWAMVVADAYCEKNYRKRHLMSVL